MPGPRSSRWGRVWRLMVAVQAGLLASSALAPLASPVLAAGDGALQLNGSSQYATLGTANDLRSATFTIELWFKRTGTGATTSTGSGGDTSIIPLLTKGRAEDETPAQDVNYFLGIDSATNTLAADFEEGAGGAHPSQNHPVYGSTPITVDGMWHHAAATYDGADWFLYLDGVQDGTASPNEPANAATNVPTVVGGSLNTLSAAAGYFAGVIDEVRIWDYARSENQIDGAKDAAIASGQTGLLGVWNLDDGSGSSLGDNSGNGITGAAVGSPAWVDGFTVAPSSSAPDAPTLNAPANAGTGISTSPTLDVGVSDPDGGTLTVTYYGRPYASGNFAQIAQHTGVAAGGNDTATWSNPGDGQKFEWYATVSDGSLTTTGPTWTFTTSPGSDPVFVGAGDIADCGRTQDEATGAVMSGILGNVWTAGDNVYPSGSVASNWDCYEASWGGAIKARTRPVPGNHDWGTGQGGVENLVAYNAYFGSSATDAGGKSYYSYDIPSSNWHIVNLDTECQLVPGGCAAGSAQELWLRADLTANSSKNVIAVWHKPRYSSGATNYQTLQPMYDDLYEFGVDILLQGHDHIYERMAPIKSGATLGSDPVADPAYGIRQFTVGTGGASLQSCPGTPLATSDACNSSTYGVMKFTLHATSYDWQFLPIAGSTFTDSGTGSVHGAPGGPSANSGLQLTTTSYVTFGDPAKLDLAQFTIETWFKKTGTGTPNTTGSGGITILPLLTHGAPQSEGSDVDANWILGINTTGNVIAADFEGIDDPPTTGQNAPISGATPIADNVWHHAAATFDGTTFAVYLDGNLEASSTPGFHPRSDSRQGVGLGTMITTDDFGDGPSYLGRFDGVIDEARVWSVARTQGEIQATKDLELISGTGLVARWGLNEGSGTSVGDSMTTPATGTISGTGSSWVAGFVPPAPDPAPDAPANLAASASTAGISLTWDPNTELDLAGYNVYRSTSPGVTTVGTPINGALLTSPTYVDSNVAGGTTYYYVVTAVDTGSHKSDPSNEVSAVAVGSGLQLTTTSYVTFGDPAKLDLAQFTIETWFKKTGTGTPNTTGSGGITILPLLTHGAPQSEGSDVDANWILGINTTGNVIAADFEGIDDPPTTGQNYPISGATPIADNVWHHAAATFDGTTFAVYLDGNLEASGTPGFHPRSDSAQHVALGTMIETDGTTTHGRFDGVLDEARVWNVARSGAAILADKNNELTSGTGLVARWGLNEGSGTSVGDSMPTPANGNITVTGSSWVAGAPVTAAGSNTAPDAPTLNAPSDAATDVVLSPTLDVDVSDPDGDPLTVTYYGRPLASGNFTQIAQHTGVASDGNDTATWADLGAGQTFEWYVTVDDGTASAVVGPTWTFHTVASTDPVFVGVGDIASCDVTTDTATGNVIAGIDGSVFTTGDNVYPNGTATDFTNCYAPTPWGSTPVLSRTRPVPGNHDWGTGVTDSLDGYFGYYGDNATDAGGMSYYSYDIPDSNWHVVNLDSECAQVAGGGCAAGSDQELWLGADLAANSTKNVIALWHKPRYSSGATNLQALQPLWDDLYAAGVDILMDGHDHIYERFTPMKSGATPADPPVADATYGIQQFTVGMGGEAHHNLGTTLGTSLIRNNTDFGIFKLTLHATTYDWVFLPIAGSTFTDSGTGTVHGAPEAPSYTLSGTVTAAGPVAGAVVYVFDAGTAAYAGNAVTAGDGSYSLDLPAGSYKLWIQTNVSGYPDQAYGPDGSFETATPVDLTSGNATADVVLVAAPTSHTLSGTVTAAGPVAGAVVYVFDAGTAAYAGNAVTAGDGSYSLDLPAGSYKLWIQTNVSGYPDQAYGPDGSFETATPVDLTSGNATADVVLVAAPTSHTLSGTVTAAGPVAGAVVYVFDAGTAAYAGNAVTAGDGSYSLDLPAGSYKLWIQTNVSGYPDQAYGPDGSFETATPVDLTSGNATADVVLVAAPTSHTLSGTVTAAGPVAGAVVYVFDAGTAAYAGNAVTAGDGSYSLDLPAGSYKLWIQTNVSGYPDQAYGPDGSFETATPVDLTSGNATADVVLVAAP